MSHRASASDLLSSGGLADQATQAELQRLQQVCGALEQGAIAHHSTASQQQPIIGEHLVCVPQDIQAAEGSALQARAEVEQAAARGKDAELRTARAEAERKAQVCMCGAAQVDERTDH